jgi:hypothetical protein
MTVLRRLALGGGLIVLLTACGGRPTATPTALPAGGTNLAQPTPSLTQPTAIPAPPPDRLTTEQLSQRLDPFGAPDCVLPCFNGLTPGDAGLVETLGFYARLGIGVTDLVPGDYQTALSGTGNVRATLMRSSDVVEAVQAGFVPPEANIYLDQGKVQIVYARWNAYPGAVAAPRILTALGPPDQVGLAMLFTAEPNVPTRFVIEMLYPGKQTGFLYLGDAAGDAAARQVCLTDVAVKETIMGIYAPGLTPLSDNPAKARLLPLEQSAGVSITDFVAAAAGGGCLSIAADRWDQWHP